VAQDTAGKPAETNKELLGTNSKQSSTLLQIIASAISQLLVKERVDKPIKITLERILRFIKVEEEKGTKRAETYVTQSEVSNLQRELKLNLVKLQDTLATQIKNVQVTASSALENTAKTLADMKDLKKTTKEITNKVGKVNDATDKIATTTQSYCDVLLQNLVAAAGKYSLDPKILGDMERKARQILVDIHDQDDSEALSKSIIEVISKANDSLGKITDAEKPAKV
jgi:methyl-accepting chemotaxis protein